MSTPNWIEVYAFYSGNHLSPHALFQLLCPGVPLGCQTHPLPLQPSEAWVSKQNTANLIWNLNTYPGPTPSHHTNYFPQCLVDPWTLHAPKPENKLCALLHTGWPMSLMKTSRWLSSDSIGSWWAATIAAYCPGRMAEHLKSKSTGGFHQQDVSPCTLPTNMRVG